MAIWARVDADMPTDAKLVGQPVTTRHLWTCLICLARKQDAHGEIRGYDCAILAGAFNLPRKAVAAALTYFQSVRMVELDPDGTIRLVKFTLYQGPKTLAEQRAEWRDRQAKSRGESHNGVTRDSQETAREVVTRDSRESHALTSTSTREVDKSKSKDLAGGLLSQPPTAPVWQAYAAAFEKRYGAPPIRNQKVSGQLAQFVKRVAAKDAPEIAAFYVTHPAAKYASNGHPVGLLLQDAEKLAVEWVTGQKINGHTARREEKTAANVDGWTSLLKTEPEAKRGLE